VANAGAGMSITNFFVWTGFGCGAVSVIFFYYEAANPRESVVSGYRRVLAETWSEIRNSSIWNLWERLLDIFLDAAEEVNRAGQKMFQSILFLVVVILVTISLENSHSSNENHSLIRVVATYFTIATQYFIRFGFSRKLNEAGRKDYWFYWPSIALLAIPSVISLLLHTALFVQKFNDDINLLQTIMFTILFTYLLRLSYSRVVMFPYCKIFVWDRNRKNHVNEIINQASSLKSEDEEIGLDEVWVKAERMAIRKAARNENKVLSQFHKFRVFVNSMQIGFLLSAVLTVGGIYLGRQFDAGSTLVLTPQILLVNTMFDALTIGVTLSLMKWVSWAGFRPVVSSWSIRLLFAAPLDLAMAAAFSIASIYFSLLGTEFEISPNEAAELLIPNISGNYISGLGPEFWIMHTTFIPTLIYLLVLMSGAILYILFIAALQGLVSEDPNEIREPLKVLSALFMVYAASFEFLALISGGWSV